MNLLTGFDGNFFEGAFAFAAVNHDGVVALNAEVFEPTGPALGTVAIWRGEPESLQPLLRFGQPAPGTPEGFGSADEAAGAGISSNRTVLLVARLQSTYGTGALASGLWQDTGLALKELLLPHLALPEAGPGLSFGSFFGAYPDLNGHGQFVTTGFVEGVGVGTTN